MAQMAQKIKGIKPPEQALDSKFDLPNCNKLQGIQPCSCLLARKRKYGIFSFHSLAAQIISWLLIISLLLPIGLGLAYPRPAKAIASGSTVFDIPTEIATGLHYVLVHLKDWADIWWNTVFKPLLLRKITNDIVNWIQGGGKPRFVSDWQGFLTEAADEAGLVFLNELTGINWCNVDWGITLQIALRRPPVFADQAKCTLSSLLDNGGFTIEEFYEDFSKGGWVAWNKLVEPENNFYGAYFKTWQEKTNKEEAAAEAAKNDALAGKGFASDKECITCVVMGEDGKCQLCAKWTIKTPGSVIADATSKAITYNLDWLIEADEWKEYVGAIIDALINRVIREGLAKMKSGEGSHTQPYYGTYTELGDTSNPTVKITAPPDQSQITLDEPTIIIAEASDNQGIREVEFYANGKLIYTDTTAPYTCEWTPIGIADKKPIPISVIAYDKNGNYEMDYISVFVDTLNDPPVADAGEDQNIRDEDRDGREKVVLDGSGSFDIDGIITGYRWWTATTTNTIGWGKIIIKNWEVGEYIVRLEVTDNDGATDTDEVIIIIGEPSEPPPEEEE